MTKTEKILLIQHMMVFGYIEGASKTAKGNNVLVIPEREGIIVYKDGLYGIINSSGRTLLPIKLKKIYVELNNGKSSYYMTYGDDNKTENILEFLNKTLGTTTSNSSKNEVNNTVTNQTNNTTSTNVVTNSVNNTNPQSNTNSSEENKNTVNNKENKTN